MISKQFLVALGAMALATSLLARAQAQAIRGAASAVAADPTGLPSLEDLGLDPAEVLRVREKSRKLFRNLEVGMSMVDERNPSGWREVKLERRRTKSDCDGDWVDCALREKWAPLLIISGNDGHGVGGDYEVFGDFVLPENEFKPFHEVWPNAEAVKVEKKEGGGRWTSWDETPWFEAWVAQGAHASFEIEVYDLDAIGRPTGWRPAKVGARFTEDLDLRFENDDSKADENMWEFKPQEFAYGEML